MSATRRSRRAPNFPLSDETSFPFGASLRNPWIRRTSFSASLGVRVFWRSRRRIHRLRQSWMLGEGSRSCLPWIVVIKEGPSLTVGLLTYQTLVAWNIGREFVLVPFAIARNAVRALP